MLCWTVTSSETRVGSGRCRLEKLVTAVPLNGLEVGQKQVPRPTPHALTKVSAGHYMQREGVLVIMHKHHTQRRNVRDIHKRKTHTCKDITHIRKYNTKTQSQHTHKQT